jgi:predicted acyl esterase
VPDTNYRTFFLSQDQALLEEPTAAPATLTYQSDAPALQMDTDSEELSFTYTFASRSRLIGYPKAILYMSCSEHDDLDVFVQIRKGDSNGNVLQNINIPLSELGLQASQVVTINTNKYIGPTGILRASHRHIDQARSKPHWPIHSHDRDDKVVPGNIVKLEIGIWPTGIVFEQGEKLIFKIAGHELRLAEFEPLRGAFTTGNKGRHIVHIGGDHPSRVIVPFVEV